MKLACVCRKLLVFKNPYHHSGKCYQWAPQAPEHSQLGIWPGLLKVTNCWTWQRAQAGRWGLDMLKAACGPKCKEGLEPASSKFSWQQHEGPCDLRNLRTRPSWDISSFFLPWLLEGIIPTFLVYRVYYLYHLSIALHWSTILCLSSLEGKATSCNPGCFPSGDTGWNVSAPCLVKCTPPISELLSVGLKSITTTAVGHKARRDSEQWLVTAPSACLRTHRFMEASVDRGN